MTWTGAPVIGKYRVIQEIGQGGFAAVLRAEDSTLGRQVALKVLHPQLLTDQTFVERFRREARALGNLRHPNIVTIFEVGEADYRLYIAMELARGANLAQVIAQRGPIAWDEMLRLLAPICQALDYAHGQGVVHRDLKPANILMDQAEGPLLTDFGFARLMGESSVSLTVSGGILGTPAYMAPEVWELDAADVPADIYSLGCIVYEMLTGQVLFEGKTPIQAMRAHDRGPQLPETWPDDVPAGVAAVLDKALARKPADRYASAGELLAALQEVAAGEGASKAAPELAGEALTGAGPAVRVEARAETPESGKEPTLAAESRICPECGNEVAAELATCPHCEGAGRSSRPVRAPRWIWLLGGLAALALLVGIGGRTLGWWPTKATPTPTEEGAIAASTPSASLEPIATESPVPSTTATPLPTETALTITEPPEPEGAHSAIPPDCELVHVVQAGENLFRIALAHNLSFEAVAAYNRIPWPYQIEVGQELCVAVASTSPSPAVGMPTRTATPSPSPTSAGPPTAQVTGTALNLRSGPGTGYDVVGQLAAGDVIEIAARTTDGSWLQVTVEGDLAWVSAGLVETSADLEDIQVATDLPPTPTPRPSAPMTMVMVPAGDFLMGDPVKTHWVDSFWIDRTEVTNAQYRECVEAGVCDPADSCGSYGYPTFDDPTKINHPVVCVDWYDAQTYCSWAGKRLPSEAEWEKAARGTDGRSYPWGDGISCSLANYSGCVGGAAAAESYAAGASPYGALNMAGNVGEWTADGPVRGGGWRSEPDYLRPTYSGRSGLDFTYSYIGFRCASNTP